MSENDTIMIWREDCARDICGTMFVVSNLSDTAVTVMDMKLSPGLRFYDLTYKGTEEILRDFSSSGIMGDDQKSELASRREVLV